MFKHPLVIGVQEVLPKDGFLPIGEVLERVGANSGNIIFTQAIVKLLHDVRLGTFDVEACDFSGRDCVVLAAANWLNDFEDFGWLADRLEKLTLPIFVFGLGAQAPYGDSTLKLNQGTIRFLDIVTSSHGHFSVRGRHTFDFLTSLGYCNVTATGCPSLMLVGPGGFDSSRFSSVSFDRCSISSTRHGFFDADGFHSSIYRFALSQRLDIVLQSEVPDLSCLLDSSQYDFAAETVNEALVRAYGSASVVDIRNYICMHARFFTAYGQWIDYCRGRSFVFGSRVHGVVASLIAGTPAVLLAHDSRTRELAEFMGLPVVDSIDVLIDSEFCVQSLWREDSFSKLVSRSDFYYRNFLDFLKIIDMQVSPDFFREMK